MLPFLLLIFTKLPRVVSSIIYAVLIVATLGLNMWLIIDNQTGLIGRFDREYFLNNAFLEQIFMKPWFQLNVYLWGVVLCLSYIRYVRERSGLVPAEVASNSLTSRAFAFIKSNATVRYPMYVVGLVLTLLPFFGQHGYLATVGTDSPTWSVGTQGFYGAFAYFSFVLGASLFVMPALLGRAEFIRFFYGGDIFALFKNISFGMYMFQPIYSLIYFLSMSNSQHFDYQMMFYNFCGIFLFSLIFVQIFYVFVHCPFTSLFNLSHDIDMVNSDLNLAPQRTINIEDYHVKGDEDDSPLAQDDAEISPVSNKEQLLQEVPAGKKKGMVFDSEIQPGNNGGNINMTTSRVEQSTFMDQSAAHNRK